MLSSEVSKLHEEHRQNDDEISRCNQVLILRMLACTLDSRLVLILSLLILMLLLLLLTLVCCCWYVAVDEGYYSD